MGIKTLAIDAYRYVRYGRNIGTNSKGISVYKRGSNMTALDRNGNMTFRSTVNQTGKASFETEITKYKTEMFAGRSVSCPDTKTKILRHLATSREDKNTVFISHGVCPNGSEAHTSYNNFTTYAYGVNPDGKRWVDGYHQIEGVGTKYFKTK